jgi:hypothetical protein
MYECTNLKSNIRTEEAIDNIEFDKKFTCTNLRIYESKEKFTFVKNVKKKISQMIGLNWSKENLWDSKENLEKICQIVN